jgi:hypothetical protein
MTRRTALAALIAILATPVMALYDPAPEQALSAAQGEWRGSLTYRDYGQPDRLVTLPAKLFIALGAPNELVLQYMYDDGPAKAVYSYERMSIDLNRNELLWIAGVAERSSHLHRITANTQDGGNRKLAFERNEGTEVYRFTMELGPLHFKIEKSEVDAGGFATFRNRQEFTRPGV